MASYLVYLFYIVLVALMPASLSIYEMSGRLTLLSRARLWRLVAIQWDSLAPPQSSATDDMPVK